MRISFTCLSSHLHADAAPSGSGGISSTTIMMVWLFIAALLFLARSATQCYCYFNTCFISCITSVSHQLCLMLVVLPVFALSRQWLRRATTILLRLQQQHEGRTCSSPHNRGSNISATLSYMCCQLTKAVLCCLLNELKVPKAICFLLLLPFHCSEPECPPVVQWQPCVCDP